MVIKQETINIFLLPDATVGLSFLTLLVTLQEYISKKRVNLQR